MGVESEGAPGILPVEVSDAAKHPTMHRTAPSQSIGPQMSTVSKLITTALKYHGGIHSFLFSASISAHI